MRAPEVARFIEHGRVRVERELFREYDGYDQPLSELNARAEGLLNVGETRSDIRISMVDGAVTARVVRYETIADTLRSETLADRARALVERTRFTPSQPVWA